MEMSGVHTITVEKKKSILVLRRMKVCADGAKIICQCFAALMMINITAFALKSSKGVISS